MRRKNWAHVMLLLIGLALLSILTIGCGNNSPSQPGLSNSSSGSVAATAADGVVLQCRVTGENGTPVRDATVTISNTSDKNQVKEDLTVKTDSQGEFTSTVALGYELKIYIIGGKCGGSDSQSSITYYKTFNDKTKVQMVLCKSSIAGSSTGTITPSVTLTGAAKGEKSNCAALSWTQSYESNFVCYRIYRSTSPDVTTNSNLLATINNVGTTSFSDYPSNAGLYYYKVFAMVGSRTLLQGTGSNEVTVTTDTSQPGNACYLTMYSTGYVGASVLPISGALASGSYSLTQPDITNTDMTYTAGSVWTINRTYYGNPIAGSYASTIDTTIDPQRWYVNVQTSATGTYVIKNPVQDCTYNLAQTAPGEMTVNANANSDGTINVFWPNLGPNYRYMVTAWNYTMADQKIKTRWCNVDPVTVNDTKPSEFYTYGMNQLYSTNNCTIPCVFYTGDKVSIWVTGYDTTNSSYSLNNNKIGQAQVYSSVALTPAEVTVTGGIQNQGIYALFVGIDKYQYINPLNQCVNDVTGMKAAFSGSNLWSEATVETLTDDQATKANIMSKIQSLTSQTSADSLVFIYYSGHGSIDDNKLAYICPVDTKSSDDSTLISGNELYAALQTTDAKKCVIFDSCYSGGFVGKKTAARNMTTREISNYFIKSFTKQLEKLNDIVFIGACKGSQTSAETQALGHGIFTYYLIEGLGPSGNAAGPADVNKDGVVTAEEAYEYATPLATKYNPDQNAQMQDNYGGDLEIKK
ncbi:MAG: caspase family protein [Vulcanimicrobiota bacterium]